MYVCTAADNSLALPSFGCCSNWSLIILFFYRKIATPARLGLSDWLGMLLSRIYFFLSLSLIYVSSPPCLIYILFFILSMSYLVYILPTLYPAYASAMHYLICLSLTLYHSKAILLYTCSLRKFGENGKSVTRLGLDAVTSRVGCTTCGSPYTPINYLY